MTCPVGYDCVAMVGVSDGCPNRSTCSEIFFPVTFVNSRLTELRHIHDQQPLLAIGHRYINERAAQIALDHQLTSPNGLTLIDIFDRVRTRLNRCNLAVKSNLD